jgi:acyl-CoA dehydrogenase
VKSDVLPDITAGDAAVQAFGLTEPNSGSDSTSIQTLVEKDGDSYTANGQQVWFSCVDASDYILLMARTTPKLLV